MFFFYNHLYQPSVFRSLFLKRGAIRPFFSADNLKNPVNLSGSWIRSKRNFLASSFAICGAIYISRRVGGIFFWNFSSLGVLERIRAVLVGWITSQNYVFGNTGQLFRRSDTKLQFCDIAYFIWLSTNLIAPPYIRFRHESYNSRPSKIVKICIWHLKFSSRQNLFNIFILLPSSFMLDAPRTLVLFYISEIPVKFTKS
jgi:hypothetical protein